MMKSMKTVMVGFLLLTVLISVSADVTEAAVPDEAREGTDLYRDSAFAAAADAFRQATIAAPEDPRWRYDLGLSEAQGQDYENALNNLQSTAGLADSSLAGAALYNAGNVHLAMGNNAEAAKAYRETLLRNPDDTEAKHNLELALRRLEQQQQEEQQEQDSKDGEEEKQDQEEQQKSDEKQDQEQNQDQQDSENQEQNEDPQDQPESQPQSDSTLTREQAERILRALAEEEAKLRDKARKIQAMPAPAGKDW
jgi:Ca-activated chloride channel family protein